MSSLSWYPGRSVTTICSDKQLREFGKVRIKPQFLGNHTPAELPSDTKEKLSVMLYGAGNAIGFGVITYFELPTNQEGFGVSLGRPDKFNLESIEDRFNSDISEVVFVPQLGITLYANQFTTVVQSSPTTYTKYPREDAPLYLVPDTVAVELLPPEIQKQILIQEV